MDGETEITRKTLKGSSTDTTNNQMELTAAIEALRATSGDKPIFVRSDSEYVIKGITIWVAGWKARGWRKADKKPVVNKELWEALDELAGSRSVTWEWVRGHNGDPFNEEVDRMANDAARAARWV